MDNILALTEEDIKLRYITPSILQKGWSVEDITMETKVKLTDGKINLRGNLVARGKAKFADYMLYYNRATPIAIVEAKDANHTVSFGMQQAKEYAQTCRPGLVPMKYQKGRFRIDSKRNKTMNINDK